MVLKTFNLEEDAYKQFSEFCKLHGISMSKQINLFIKAQMTEEPEVREDYIKKLEIIRKGDYTVFDSINDLVKATS